MLFLIFCEGLSNIFLSPASQKLFYVKRPAVIAFLTETGLKQVLPHLVYKENNSKMITENMPSRDEKNGEQKGETT